MLPSRYASAQALWVSQVLLRARQLNRRGSATTLRQFMNELKISCFGLGVESSKDLDRSHILEITDAD